MERQSRFYGPLRTAHQQAINDNLNLQGEWIDRDRGELSAKALDDHHISPEEWEEALRTTRAQQLKAKFEQDRINSHEYGYKLRRVQQMDVNDLENKGTIRDPETMKLTNRNGPAFGRDFQYAEHVQPSRPAFPQAPPPPVQEPADAKAPEPTLEGAALRRRLDAISGFQHRQLDAQLKAGTIDREQHQEGQDAIQQRYTDFLRGKPIDLSLSEADQRAMRADHMRQQFAAERAQKQHEHEFRL